MSRNVLKLKLEMDGKRDVAPENFHRIYFYGILLESQSKILGN
jgi:hypothetical protein